MAADTGHQITTLTPKAKLTPPPVDLADVTALDNQLMSDLHDQHGHKAASPEELKLQATIDDLYKKLQDGALPEITKLPSKPQLYITKDDDNLILATAYTDKGSSAIILSSGGVINMKKEEAELRLARELGTLVVNVNDPKFLEKYTPLNTESIKKDLEAWGLSETNLGDKAFIESYMSKVKFEMMAMSLVNDPLTAVKQSHILTNEEKQDLENQYREAAKAELGEKPRYPQEVARITDQVRKDAKDHKETLTEAQIQDRIIDKIYENVKKSAATPGQEVLEYLARMVIAKKQATEPAKTPEKDKPAGHKLGQLTPLQIRQIATATGPSSTNRA